MQSKAKTVAAYLASLPAERRATLEAVRSLIRENLDPDFEEGMQYGMIGYYVPHALYPNGYHCDPQQPLPFTNLAAQKNYFSLYLFCLYAGGELQRKFVADWKKAGKRLNMGKSCIRFQCVEDLATEVLAKTFRTVSVKRYIQSYEAALAEHQSQRAAGRKAKPAARSKKPAKPRTKTTAVRGGRAGKTTKTLD